MRFLGKTLDPLQASAEQKGAKWKQEKKKAVFFLLYNSLFLKDKDNYYVDCGYPKKGYLLAMQVLFGPFKMIQKGGFVFNVLFKKRKMGLYMSMVE